MTIDIKILFVEDNPDITEQMKIFFSRRREEVFYASNGLEGFSVFMERRPDIVISDIRMPFMDGLDMSQKIREASPDIKIILTTAYSDCEYLMRAIELGIDHYVVKPIDLEKLALAIDKCSEMLLFKRAEERLKKEREELICELQSALMNVKRLSGLLPICSSCKKIRDDKGYWQMVEEYIMERSEAEFTHGLCPDCLEKLYPWTKKR